VRLNPLYEYSQIETDRQWKVHSCFDSCRPDPNDPDAEIDTGFTVDERPICTEDSAKDIICLNPFENDCEVFSTQSQTCFDSLSKVCIDWTLIIIAIVISNCA